ncbi:hypothetical protein D3C78_1857930 [compost metagenome]
MIGYFRTTGLISFPLKRYRGIFFQIGRLWNVHDNAPFPIFLAQEVAVDQIRRLARHFRELRIRMLDGFNEHIDLGRT